MGTSRSSLASADMKLLDALSLLCSVLAQDTYHCPDGWVLEEDRSGCRCFYFEGEERVTRDNADLLCQFHDAWVAELDHPGINYWLKSQLLNKFEAGDRTQFWMGASLGSVTTRMLQGSGSGLTRTRLSSGSTGLMENPTTTTESTAWA